MNFRLSVTSLLFSITSVGCATELSAPHNTSLHALAVAPNDGRADATVNGTIRGQRLVNPGDSTSHERVSDATIKVYLEFNVVPVDSTRDVARHQLLGTVTSDAQGSFQLTNVPAGYYSLAVAPPPGSPYKPAVIGTVAVAPGSEQIAIVWVYLK